MAYFLCLYCSIVRFPTLALYLYPSRVSECDDNLSHSIDAFWITHAVSACARSINATRWIKECYLKAGEQQILVEKAQALKTANFYEIIAKAIDSFLVVRWEKFFLSFEVVKSRRQGQDVIVYWRMLRKINLIQNAVSTSF